MVSVDHSEEGSSRILGYSLAARSNGGEFYLGEDRGLRYVYPGCSLVLPVTEQRIVRHICDRDFPKGNPRLYYPGADNNRTDPNSCLCFDREPYLSLTPLGF